MLFKLNETEREIKMQDSRRQKITINIEFKYLKLVVDTEVVSQRRVSQAGQEYINVEIIGTSSDFNNEIMRSSWQSNTAVKVHRSRYQRGEFISTITMKDEQRRKKEKKRHVTEIGK